MRSTATTIHIGFEPRIWLAGRRLMSMSTAVLRMASPIAVAMISLRLRSLRSLHRLAIDILRFLAAALMTCTLHREELAAGGGCGGRSGACAVPGHRFGVYVKDATPPNVPIDPVAGAY